jgi:hypothetical protein
MLCQLSVTSQQIASEFNKYSKHFSPIVSVGEEFGNDLEKSSGAEDLTRLHLTGKSRSVFVVGRRS